VEVVEVMETRVEVVRALGARKQSSGHSLFFTSQMSEVISKMSRCQMSRKKKEEKVLWGGH